jgi:hypothetical protein
MNDHLLWLLLSGLVSAVVSAFWNHLSKRSLQREDADTKIGLANLENQFAQAERRAQAEYKRVERLDQAAIDRSIFVTRAHFETEFEAMKQVFDCLSRLAFCVAAMRPIDADCPIQHEADRRLSELRAEYNGLRKLVEAKLPFYTEELYGLVQACLSAAWRETDDLDRMKDPYDDVGRKRAEGNQSAFETNYKKAAAVIRERISRLAILPT